MSSRLPILHDHLRVATPCDAKWDEMAGDDKRRYCGDCKLFVYNVPELTPEELVTAIERSEGRFCGRLYQRPDGTVLTSDCPVGLAARARRKVVAAGAFVATVMTSAISLVLGGVAGNPFVMGEIAPPPQVQTVQPPPHVAPPVQEPEMIEMLGDIAYEPPPPPPKPVMGRIPLPRKVILR